MIKDKIVNFYNKIELIPSPRTFTLFFIVSLLSLSLGIYNNYQIRNLSTSPQNVVNGKKVLPIKDLTSKVNKNSQKIGNESAKVVMVAFEDFQCPFCKKFHDENFKQIKEKYIDTGKVLFIHQDLAFLGIESNASAEAAQCAGEQGKFWEYKDLLYENQTPTHNAGNFKDDNLKKLAKNLGLNTVQFNECFDSQKYKDLINETKVFADSYGILSTPSFIINGTLVRGARPLADFELIINGLLKN